MKASGSDCRKSLRFGQPGPGFDLSGEGFEPLDEGLGDADTFIGEPGLGEFTQSGRDFSQVDRTGLSRMIEADHDARLASLGGAGGLDAASPGIGAVAGRGQNGAGASGEPWFFAAGPESGLMLDQEGESVAEVGGETLAAIAVHLDVSAEGVAVFVALAFANGDDTASKTSKNAFHIVTNGFQRDFLLGQIDQVGGVFGRMAGEGGGGGDPTGIAAEGLDDHDGGGQRAVVLAGIADGVGKEAGDAAVAGRVIGAGDVVVDGFGDADDLEAAAGGFGEMAGGAHGAVSAVEEGGGDAVLEEDPDGLLITGFVESMAGGAEGGSGGEGDLLEKGFGGGVEVEEVLGEESGEAEAGAEEGPVSGAAEFEGEAGERGIEDGGGSAAVDQDGAADHISM